jgi:hypothetical protein
MMDLKKLVLEADCRGYVQSLYESFMYNPLFVADAGRYVTADEKKKLFAMIAGVVFKKEARDIAREFELQPPIPSKMAFSEFVDFNGGKTK